MNQQNDFIRKTVEGLSWMSGYTFVNVLINLVVTAVLARLLDKNEHGIIAAVMIVISFSRIFYTFCAGPAIVYKKELTNKDINTAITLTNIFGIVVYIILFFSAESLEVFFEIEEYAKILRILGLSFIINSFGVVPQSLLQKKLMFKNIATIMFISVTLVYSTVAILLAYLGFSYWSIVYANIVSSIVSTVLFVFNSKKFFSRRLIIDKHSCSHILKYGFGMTISNVISNFALQGDYLIVTKTLGTGATGIYSKAYQLLTYPATLLGKIFDQVFFPVMAKIRDDRPKMKEIFFSNTRIFALLSIFVTNIFCIAAKDVVEVILGDGWQDVVFPLRVFGVVFFFRLSYKISDLVCKAVGAVYNRAFRITLYTIMVIMGAFIGSKWGVGSVAIGVSIAIVINFIVMTSYSLKYLNINWIDYFVMIYPIIIIEMIMFLSSNLIYNRFTFYNPLFNIILIVMFNLVLMPVVSLLLFSNYFRKDIEFVRTLFVKRSRDNN